MTETALLTPTSTDSTTATQRVLHIINGEHYSGAERVQDLLAMRLPEFGYDASFATVKPGKFADSRKAKNVRIYDSPMQSSFDLKVARQLAKLVKEEDFKVVHSHTVRTSLVGRVVASLAKVPFVYHVHSPASNDSTRKWMNRINAWVERICLTGVDQLVCVSESLAKHMIDQGYDPTRVTVVPNGVPTCGDLIERDPPTKQWVLGTIALFRPRKGTELLIEALSILRKAGHDVRVRAVGPFETAEYENKLKSIARIHNVEAYIDWTGFTNDVHAELQQMDAMVLPSTFGEGMPMVVLEAMAAGVPVVGTTVQGVPEVLTDGIGLLAKPGCSEDLANTISQLITGKADWSSIRSNAWQRQADRFSDRSMAEGVAQVYDRLLK